MLSTTLIPEVTTSWMGQLCLGCHYEQWRTTTPSLTHGMGCSNSSKWSTTEKRGKGGFKGIFSPQASHNYNPICLLKSRLFSIILPGFSALAHCHKVPGGRRMPSYPHDCIPHCSLEQVSQQKRWKERGQGEAKQQKEGSNGVRRGQTRSGMRQDCQHQCMLHPIPFPDLIPKHTCRPEPAI